MREDEAPVRTVRVINLPAGRAMSPIALRAIDRAFSGIPVRLLSAAIIPM
jgi:hypothetical protein